ncbi:MAG: M6 family metalloprotease domain-containing protein [Paludibacteraceae bacterium]|nr:M6 family metalloprotease domain-containing protein [Paludibacteraceae bacterium]
MKKTFICLFMLMLAGAANAIPAKPGKVRLATKDGSTVEVSLIGDEFHHNFVTAEGYMVKQVEGRDYYVITDRRFDAVEADSQRMAMKSKKARPVNAPKSTAGTGAFTKGLVILAGFSDYAFTETNAGFNDLLNQEGYNYNKATGSVKDYFKSTSYGQYNPTFDVYGPYTLPETMGYYGSNDWGGSDAHADQMVVDAVAALVAEQGEEVLARYDCDNDGYVDNVFVYYAGYAESSGAPSHTIWPHRWIISSYFVTGRTTYGGKTIYDYACSSEFDGTSGQKRTGIGAFCHEFSHVLGLPDLYVTSDSYYNTPATPEDWDIMDGGCYNNNENTPPAYSSEERFYVGWLTPTIINEAGSYTLADLNDEATAYLISSTGTHNLQGQNPNPQKYYLFENRQKKGWDKYVPGHGMLVWQIQYNRMKWEANTVNNSASSMGCTIVSAKDPDNFVNRSASAGDPFPGSRYVTSYAPYSNYQLSDITETGSQISFNVATPSSIGDAGMAEGIVMFSVDGENYTVDNMPEGASLRCYDAIGRMLWSAEGVGTTYTFSNRRGMFVLQVVANGKVCVLKGL